MELLSNCLNEFKKLVNSNKVFTIILATLIVCLSLVLTVIDSDDNILSQKGLLQLGLITAICVVIIFKDKSPLQVLRVASMVAVPAIALCFLLMFYFTPLRIEALAWEDHEVENASFGLLLLSSALMIIAASIMARQKNSQGMIFASIASVLFFILGMEEASWMQRFIGVETSPFFLEHNQQQEINLHNFNTALTSQVYLAGGFVLLVVIPYFRKFAEQFMDKIGLIGAKRLLPPAWLVPTFMLTYAFAHSNIMHVPVHQFITIACLIIMCRMSVDGIKDASWAKVIHIIVIAMLFISIISYLSTIDHYTAALKLRYSEFTELFIAWGIATYACHVVLSLKTPNRLTDNW